MINRNDLLKEFNHMGIYIFERLQSTYELNINNFNSSNSILIIVDMNNGFAKYGDLYDERIEKLINPIVLLANKMNNKNIPIICFSDNHSKTSTEFSTYPEHCLSNTTESQIIDELKEIKKIKIMPKNSTNGFFAENFKPPCNKHNFIIVGNCTDICVYQLATTLKSYFNQLNEKKRILVPINLVDTFDSENHKADFMNYIFLNSMIDNGIEVVKLNIN